MRNRFPRSFRIPLRAVRAAVGALALLMAGAGAASAAEIILYDGRDFEDQSVSLTQSTPNLGNFDNEASSVRVISGTWILYRNANYGETPNRPSLTLGPGDYPNLSDVGFPRNKLSSVALAGGGAPPPPPQPQACTGSGQVPNGSGGCRGCSPGSIAGPNNDRCVCGPGRQVLGLRGNGDDRCGPPAQPSDSQQQQPRQRPNCIGGQVPLGDGCVTCPENTQPNATNSRCVCAPGMLEVGTNNTGAVCILPTGPTNQSGSRGGGGNVGGAGTQTVEVPAGNAWYVAHRQFGFNYNVRFAGNGLSLCQAFRGSRVIQGVIVLDTLTAAPGNDYLCEIVMFQGDIDPAWNLSFSQPRQVDGSCASASVTPGPGTAGQPAFIARFSATPGGPGCLMYIDTITFTGPASGKWEEAFE